MKIVNLFLSLFFFFAVRGADWEKGINEFFEKQRYEFPQEKVYVHTDRVDYMGGDTIWMRAYVTDASSHLPVNVSKYLYVELKAPSDSVLMRVRIKEDNGVYAGYMALPLSPIEACYTLTAYTAFMEGLSADREEERERLISYIRTVYPLYGFGLWMLEKREPERREKGGCTKQYREEALGGRPERAGDCIGRAGFFWRENAVAPELGFAIRKTEQKKGYCLEACRAILKYGFEELDFSEVQALTRPGNRAAEAVLARLGFQKKEITEADGALAVRWLLRRTR